MSLQVRLEILESTGTISKETKESLERVIKMFKDKYDIELSEGLGAMMITHLAMAITRIKKGEPVKEISEEVYEEILESEHFSKCEEVYENLAKELDVTLPESEIKYMLVNICVILETVNG